MPIAEAYPAVLATVKVKDDKKKDQVIVNLQRLNEFIRVSNPQCVARSYFTSPIKKEPGSYLVGHLEIYADESRRAATQASQEYKLYRDSLLNEQLSEADESVTLWQVAGGFLSRKNEHPTAKAGVLMVAKFTSLDGDNTQKLVKELQNFCNWVETNEPSTYTYCLFTSQTAAKEVLLFERYKDVPSLKVHGSTQEFKSMLRLSILLLFNKDGS
ncbi:hypothetical protein TARUN_8566 [Trichoderma arundinaceum]|uniref:ABM domain-containing protein n=1 Tax=Trichoderma arundinaceum TaxID=490622 RepID=A0A395NCM2_TRIAR|nr:hypothetical protein TARUN_8566 [Trichoderma arundinaceum]